VSSSSISNEIMNKLSEYTTKKVHFESEIYYDLGIYGDDLYEIFDYIISKYETDLSYVDASKLAPGEGGDLIALIARSFGFRLYQSLKVCHLINWAFQGTKQNSDEL
jgi:hypothetical protein